MKFKLRKEPSEYEKRIKKEYAEAKRKAFEEEHTRLALEKADTEGKRIAKERITGRNIHAEKILKPFAYFAKGIVMSANDSKKDKSKSELRKIGQNFADFVSSEDEIQYHRDKRYSKASVPKRLKKEFVEDEGYDARLIKKMKKNGIKDMSDLL